MPRKKGDKDLKKRNWAGGAKSIAPELKIKNRPVYLNDVQNLAICEKFGNLTKAIKTTLDA